VADGIPEDQAGSLTRSYGPGSRPRPQQLFIHPSLSTYFLTLNTSRPLFATAALRRAVNYAIDRRALTSISGVGSPATFPRLPTDQYLPPGLPGFSDAQIYPLNGPDLNTAKRLARGHGGRAVLYTCALPPCQDEAAIIKADLAPIGIDVVAKSFSVPELFQRVGNRGEPFDIASVGYQADYADPADFLNLLLDGRSIGPRDNLDYAYFNDPAFNARMERAATLNGRARLRAYTQLDHDLAAQAAPFAAIGNGVQYDFFSTTIGCQLYQPIYGIDLGALCRRH
jgi:ABC-type oligopeptide transport system substrate-binding subunit